MKRLSTLDVSTNGSLRVKRRTVVFTGHKNHTSSSKEVLEKEQVSPDRITLREVDDSDFEIELTEIRKTLEDRGQGTVDELGTPEQLRPTYVSSLLTSEEEKEYFNLLGEYKDVFEWSIKRCLG